MLHRFESALVVLDGVFLPSDPPTLPTLVPTGQLELFPEVTVISGISVEGDGIAGGGFEVTN